MHLLKTKQETNLIDISQTPILIKYYTLGRTIIWDYSQRDNQGTAPNTGTLCKDNTGPIFFFFWFKKEC